MKKQMPEKTISQLGREIYNLFNYPKDRPNPFNLKEFIEKSLQEDEKLMPEEGDYDE
jgi:hypothetical protein